VSPLGAARGTADLTDRIEAALGRRPRRFSPLTGGCIAEIHKVDLDSGERVVAKVSAKGGLAIEGAMLDYLAGNSALPVPAVLHCDDELLILEYIETGGRPGALAEEHAAELLAALHGITEGRFGFERDTVIGPLAQPNPWTASWRAFFRDRRLLYMGRVALESGHLPAGTLAELERFCGRLERFIEEPPKASLIHGDVWGGNVLTRGGRIAAFVDPAIYYADPEIELAFSTLFATFGDSFFARYRELRPIAPGFFEARRDIYNLYPLLVHTTLFGGHYGAQVSRILARYG
jgi:fructosamine-3-kinase